MSPGNTNQAIAQPLARIGRQLGSGPDHHIARGHVTLRGFNQRQGGHHHHLQAARHSGVQGGIEHGGGAMGPHELVLRGARTGTAARRNHDDGGRGCHGKNSRNGGRMGKGDRVG